VEEERIIRAHEIGQYVYCARAWWLESIQGVPSANVAEMTAGEIAHRRHGRRVDASLWLSRLAYALLVLAVVIGIGRFAGWW